MNCEWQMTSDCEIKEQYLMKPLFQIWKKQQNHLVDLRFIAYQTSNQIENTSKVKERLGVATEHRNYRCLIMPFGSTRAPGTFAKNMYDI